MSENRGAASEAGAYTVLINSEEQYSLWPSKKVVPAGWTCVGVYGSKSECLEYIDKTWLDITPRSVRERLKSSEV